MARLEWRWSGESFEINGSGGRHRGPQCYHARPYPGHRCLKDIPPAYHGAQNWDPHVGAVVHSRLRFKAHGSSIPHHPAWCGDFAWR
jgi:hypothetical protein